mgnify:CR=1 FL=1
MGEDLQLRHLYIIMGPAGCGKSTIANALSDQNGWAMIEADTHHSSANVEKQAKGIPLTDTDRASWISSIVETINQSEAAQQVLACSALTPYVQQRLSEEVEPVCHWFLLNVSREELNRRLSSRQEHFMPASLLDDQLSALNPPEQVQHINGEQPISQICADILDLV